MADWNDSGCEFVAIVVLTILGIVSALLLLSGAVRL